jgi:fluoroquinolone resistance protein
MNKVFYQDRIFVGAELNAAQLAKAEFEQCTFRNCSWPGADLSDARFTDCSFEQCDLSTSRVKNTGFRSVRFTGCKLLGVQFESCAPFLLAMRFAHCRLDLASFRGLKLKGTVFQDCTLREADLIGTDLNSATFEDCDLAGALFEHTNLEAADLRTASNYLIDPEQNRIKGARFSIHGLPGLLARYAITVE